MAGDKPFLDHLMPFLYQCRLNLANQSAGLAAKGVGQDKNFLLMFRWADWDSRHSGLVRGKKVVRLIHLLYDTG